MTIVAPPPNPSLVAIILVVQARSGPRLVYHYPPSPLLKTVLNRSEGAPSPYEDSSGSDDDTNTTSDEDYLLDGYGRGRAGAKRTNVADEEDEDSSNQGIDDKKRGGWRVPWEHILGLDASALERLLMPSDRSWHKRKFEVGFNELVFLGWPVFMREDGTWRKKRGKRKVQSDKPKDIAINRGPDMLAEGKHDKQEPFDTLGETDLAASVTTITESVQTEGSREMTIFNVVFVLNPPVLEYSLRVREMYDHVVKKLGRALKWEQAHANYVWKQSEIILKAKAQARHKSTSSRPPLYLVMV